MEISVLIYLKMSCTLEKKMGNASFYLQVYLKVYLPRKYLLI